MGVSLRAVPNAWEKALEGIIVTRDKPCLAVRATASAQIYSGRCIMRGIVICKHGTGEFTVRDGIGNSGTILFNPATTGGNPIHFDIPPFIASDGIYFNIVSGTLDVTFFVEPL